MANLEIRFQAPLTRPGIKLDKIKRKRGGGGGGGGGEETKKITPGLKVRFEDALSKNFWLYNNDEKQKALMVEGMKLVIWNHQELKSK